MSTVDRIKKFVVGDNVFYVNENLAAEFDAKSVMRSTALACVIYNRKTDTIIKSRWLLEDVLDMAFRGEANDVDM